MVSGDLPYRSPSIEAWSELTDQWITSQVVSREVSPLRASIRAEMFTAIQQFQQQKSSLIRELTDREVRAEAMDEKEFQNRALVVAGHQPVIYHHGLLRKQLDTVNFAKSFRSAEHQGQGLAVNLIIDTDFGLPGELLYPTSDLRAGARRASVSLSDRTTAQQMFCGARVSLEAGKTFSGVVGKVRELGKGNSSTLELLTTYLQKAAGLQADWMLFNSAVREILVPESASLEIPFSALCQLPAVKEYFSHLLADPEKLFFAYNAALDEFRAEHKIKNIANPFPNLKGQGGERELPFWILDGSNRIVLTLADLKKSPYLSIVPRGAFISFFFRTAFSDLFIHGRGGESYDQFLPTLGKHLHSWPICPMAVSSETQLLFPDEAARYAELEYFEVNKKDIISHTRKYLSTLPEQLKTTTGANLDKRDTILTELQTVSPTDRSSVLHSLNAINSTIRARLDPWFAEKGAELRLSSEEYRKTIADRTFPFWLFSKYR